MVEARQQARLEQAKDDAGAEGLRKEDGKLLTEKPTERQLTIERGIGSKCLLKAAWDVLTGGREPRGKEQVKGPEVDRVKEGAQVELECRSATEADQLKRQGGGSDSREGKVISMGVCVKGRERGREKKKRERVRVCETEGGAGRRVDIGWAFGISLPVVSPGTQSPSSFLHTIPHIPSLSPLFLASR